MAHPLADHPLIGVSAKLIKAAKLALADEHSDLSGFKSDDCRDWPHENCKTCDLINALDLVLKDYSVR